MIALPPNGNPRISGGDALVINNGNYKIGYGAPGAESCVATRGGECVMAAIPSGPDASHPTRVFGAGFSSGCSSKSQLWGTRGIYTMLNLDGTNHAQISCLEITDRNPCIVGHADANLKCNSSSNSVGDWAGIGIHAADSSSIYLKDIDIHGMANRGILSGRLKDWTVENMRLAYNGWAGWDGDLGNGNTSNSGTMKFSHWLVEWNGCGEAYPNMNTPIGCWGDTVGGYGDGVGTGTTGGNWIIEDSVFQYNTSDGLDLLYHDASGSVQLNRVISRGNAGNQVKVTGNLQMINSIILGNCSFFSGKSFVYGLESCRAEGDAVATSASRSDHVLSIVNSTIVSEGNVAILTGSTESSGNAKLNLLNNVMIGLTKFRDSGQSSADTYVSAGAITINESYAIKSGLRSVQRCNQSSNICTNERVITNSSPVNFDPSLFTGSLALDSGAAVGGLVPAIDFYGALRPAASGIDRGAIEKQ